MDADEPIQSDASTVYRSSDGPMPSGDSAHQSGAQSVSNDAPPDQGIENAETVIRSGEAENPPSAHVGPRSGRTPVTVAKVLLGKKLNHFFLEELIGGGGMGAVFRAHDQQLDREVAIKVIPFAGDADDLQRRFRNEAQSAAKLDHPRIARVFDVGNHSDWYYIVFEYVQGVNVRDLVASSGVLGVDDAIFYTCQVAEALQHSAERGIVHRDVKPSNVLIDEARNVKLVDMGLARSDKMEVNQEDLTASGVTLGTFDYISPEQARDPRAADLRSDIYSLGCTLYFMLTGQPPYPGGTMLQKLLSHGNSPPPDARLVRSEISYELSAIIQRMLAKDPGHRYQSANQLIAELRQLAFREGHERSQGVDAVASGSPSAALAWIEKNSPWIIAATVLVATAGWLELSAGSSRDEFSITRPSDLGSLRVDRPMRPETDVGADDSALDSPDAATGILEGLPDEVPAIPQLQPVDPMQPPAFEPPVPNELMTSSSPEIGPITVPAGSDMDSKSLDNGTSQSPTLVRVIGPATPSTRSPEESQRIVEATGLQEALLLCDQYQINRIEFSTARVVSEPVEIRRDGLRLFSSVGGTEVVFTSKRNPERETMLSLGSNRIELDDIHLRWDALEVSSEGGSMFSMVDNRLVRMTDGSITVSNPTMSESVCAFDIAPKLGNADAMTSIELFNVIVRGQMTMIRMESATPLKLQWDNGLLAISERMLETTGALRRAQVGRDGIEISMTRVTASIPQGLLLMDLSDTLGGRFPVSIGREARSCVFEFDNGTPLIQVLGIEDLSDASSYLNVSGEANVYRAESDDKLLFSITDNDSRIESVLLSDIRMNTFAWIEEQSPGWTLWWSSIRSSDMTVDQLTPENFQQVGGVKRGFDDESLPDLPANEGDISDQAIE